MKEILEKSLLKKIERLEAFEERMGIRFEKISVKCNSYNDITIYMEVYPAKGNTIKEWINVESVMYDDKGMIIDKNSSLLNPDDFFGFEVLDINFESEDYIDKINKIRIYPKK